MSEPRSVGGETMDEEEHEVYGGEIPDEADMDADVDMALPNENAAKVILFPVTPFPSRNPRNPNPKFLTLSVRISCRSWTR